MNLSISSNMSSRAIYRIALGSLFFIQGLIFSSWASRIPTIQQSMGLSEAQLGGVLFAIPVGLLLSLPVSGWLVSKFGSWKIVVSATLLYVLVLILIGMATVSMLQLMIFLFIYGFAGNMVNISVNTQAIAVEKMYGKSIMASFHGLWSLAGFAGAAIGTIMIASGISPAYHFTMIAFVGLGTLAVSARYIIKDDIEKGSSGPLFVMPEKSLILLGGIAFSSMICEGAMFDWSGVYFKKVVMADQEWIGAGYAAFMSTMALGRFIADGFTTKFGLKRTVKISGLLIFCGLMISILFTSLPTAILGFLLVGFGVSSIVPLVYGAAGKSDVLPPGMAITAVSTIGFLGFLIGPPMIGIVAGFSSLKISFTIIACMGLSVFLLAFKIRK